MNLFLLFTWESKVKFQLQAVSIEPVAEFCPNAEVGASLATRWKDWLDYFEMFLLASEITDDTRKRVSSKVRKPALRHPNFDLKARLLEGHRDQQSTLQVKEIESRDKHYAEANKLTTQKSLKCFSCIGSYPHTGVCPAKSK